ncbi:MAG: glycosyltransferase family 4 protein [Geobacter sp.]|nr:glycosyltransferase family 4 protein [Geobacter sp.]
MRHLHDVEFVIYEPVDCRVGSWFDGAPNVSVKHTPLPSEGRVRKFICGCRYWDSALQYEGFGFFEGFNLPLVKAPTGRTLLTIHDIRGLNSEYGTLERAIFKKFLGKALRTADHVVTVSETMKKEILSFYSGVPISVIYNGLDVREFDGIPETELLAARRKFALPEEFILAVGHFERRKNYLSLIDAIALLRDRGRSCFLLIVGNDSGLKKEVERRIVSANLAGQIKILCGLSDLEVRCAYNLCSLFVFPSAYEGFGIPILEAMAASRPMVLSDIPVFREITQDRGVYFLHQDVESMAFAIENVLSSRSERARLIEYGNARVHAFSFRNLAAQMECMYRSLR